MTPAFGLICKISKSKRIGSSFIYQPASRPHTHGEAAYRVALLLTDLVPRACRNRVAMALWLVAVAVSDHGCSRMCCALPPLLLPSLAP